MWNKGNSNRVKFDSLDFTRPTEESKPCYQSAYISRRLISVSLSVAGKLSGLVLVKSREKFV
jgi:hypothetical protein